MNNILIVDDKSENLYLLELILKGSGYTTISAKNGAEALSLARQAIPDMIISDILMPVMDGFTLCRELKKDKKLYNIPFIFYTATYTDPKDEEFALSLGADRFLLKPLDITEFISTIKEVLKETKKKNIRKIEPSSSEEEVILKEYNEALVRKLEDKMVQIERAEKEVRKYNIALLRQIEERKQAEESLRESEIKYRAFFENSMDSILLTSPDGRIFSANPAACLMFGYSEEELIKLGRSAVVDTTDPRLSLMLAERTLTGKAHGELTFVRKDGTHFPAELSSSIFNDHEGLENTSMIIRDITERKRAEEALIESEEKYKIITQSTVDVIFILDKSGKLLFFNESVERGFGYKAEELIGESFTKFVQKKDLIKLFVQIKNIFQHKEISNFVTQIYHKDGHLVDVEINGKLIKQKGKYVAQGSIRDITARMRSEEEYRKLSRAVEQSPVSVIITDTKGNIEYVNPKVTEITGYQLAEVLGKNPRIFTSGEKPKSEYKILWDAITSGKEWRGEFRNKKKNGELYWELASISPIINEKGETTHYLAVKEDITERKRAEEALTHERNLLKALMDNTTDHIYIKDSENRFIRISKAHANIFGISDPAEAIGKTDFDFFTEEHARLAYDAELEIMKTGKPIVDLEEKETWPDGRVTWVSTTKVPLRDINGKVFGTFGVSRDITERNHILEELMIAKEKAEQSNKMKDTFIANISHEIRTPLNGILGMTSIIREIYSPNMTSEEEGYFEAIRKSSDRIIRTIDLILNYSQLKTGTFIIDPKQVELSSLCEEVANHFITAAISKALSLSFQNDLGKIFILADEYSIKQVIFNLLENAIIFTQNGSVNMRLYKSEQDEILLDVCDSGIGIGSEYLSHIFESFRQEKMGYSRPYEGLGLGLAVVKQILSLHNAGIKVKSKKGEGTTFTINFRKQMQKVEEKISIPNNSDKVDTPMGKSDHLVLLVEDDKLNQDVIRKYIIRKYECIVTASYDGVMELLKKQNVDLIVMDISLSESLNGLEITRKLKASKDYKHIPVIAATAHAFEQDRKAAMEAGCDDYLAKPFTVDQLLYKIDKFLQ